MMEQLPFPARPIKGGAEEGEVIHLCAPLLLLSWFSASSGNVEGKGSWQPPGFCLGKLLPRVGANAWGVSLVLGAVNLLVSLKLGWVAGLEIIGNPSIAPPGGLGAVVDERRAFLPTKEGCDVPRALRQLWLLAVSPLQASCRGLGAFWEQR